LNNIAKIILNLEGTCNAMEEEIKQAHHHLVLLKARRETLHANIIELKKETKQKLRCDVCKIEMKKIVEITTLCETCDKKLDSLEEMK